MKVWISIILAVCLLAALIGCRKRNAAPSESGSTAPATQPAATAPTRQPGEAQVEFSDFDEETDPTEEAEPTTSKPTDPKPTKPAPTTPTEPPPTTIPTQPTVPTKPQDTTPTQTKPVWGEDGYYNQVVKP